MYGSLTHAILLDAPIANAEDFAMGALGTMPHDVYMTGHIESTGHHAT